MASVPKWEPGDVAMVRLDRETEVRVMFTSNGWRGVKGAFYDLHLSARPLVVIDPEDREQVDSLTKALVEACFADGNVIVADNGIHPDTTQRALREFANPTPPIEEPTGLGAVVEDEDGLLWVRAGNDRNGRLDDNWRLTDGDKVGWWSRWDRINAVRVLSEGVPAEADR